ncbi:MAG: mannose-1-phosphate guanylyltransferase [Clostridium sp.]|uniref:mannose-1-phosphate guanylyltransferase n=1 Tax=Clostridium sp. TaxID=1506 RepID=UPI0025C0529D|nr:mannose-1-phosphate guanylyltransferase [Clostridium sp.]MCH3965337.1 mannose-1-phosphate guanylyltransferase [Clostridium sp.]MCI1714558.1 mannose-1-phosphate guanylyltransferase [Clostridium sp.]MCI1798820.1 mannose-1-phosphate guanylyltransferase [Clostridium sp.]MCI1812449.1 mannose-1-phosphate guanylyltransferase [Clostridium sp.]MCI1869630.1 mannose-1-phosphate guanylyltransferase [Clostridium sp.]
MLYALILAGGKGTRLYPLSRAKNPKQFLRVVNNKSFLRSTVDRIIPLVNKKNIYIITNEEYIAKVQEELPDISRDNIFAEPKNKETATCIGFSAVKLLKKDASASMIILPSDHYIGDQKLFLETINQAIEIAEKKRGLVTIGVKPTRPETGYGYIEMGQRINATITSFKVERFLEKPNLEVAKDLIMKGSYLWNSGMFVWRADVFLREMQKYLPKMYKSMIAIYEKLDTKEEEKVIKKQYDIIDGISVDFGIMQKTRKAYVIKCEFLWDDMGTFTAIARFLNNYKGNRIKGDTFLEASENCTIFGDGRFIIAFGVKDLIIIDSGDVLLVMDKSKDQEVKYLVDILKNETNLKKYL